MAWRDRENHDWQGVPSYRTWLLGIAKNRIAERAAVMEAALGSLPPELQEIVRLRFFEQLPLSRVAERVGIPLSTAKKYVFRGATLYRMKLKECLSSIQSREDCEE